MKKHTVKIGKREFPLAFRLKTVIKMSENIEDFNTRDLREIVGKPADMLEVLYQMILTGAELEGAEVDVDKNWIALHFPANPKKISEIHETIGITMMEDMAMETEEEEDEEVDVVLEEIKKNEATDG